jgi:acyl-CoA thioesterase FadM
MPRIQLFPAQHYSFTTDIQIYISHVNQGGHLDNAQLLTLVLRTDLIPTQGSMLCEVEFGAVSRSNFGGAHAYQ